MNTIRVIKCDLDRYNRINFDLNTGVKKSYVCTIKSTSYNKAGLLTLKFDSKRNSVVLFNQLAAVKEVAISLSSYGRVIIACDSTNAKSTLFIRYDKSLVYNFHLYTATWNTPRRAGLIKAVKPKFQRNLIVSRITKRTCVPTVEELQKDPLVLKKSKYRFKVKAFWTKQSDAARGKWSRLSRFTDVENSRGHFSLSYSYSLKHKMLNYLLWKFALTPRDLQNWFSSNRMTSSNLMIGFGSWVINRLPHVLVSSGFFGNYTLATKSIKQGDVYINNVLITDVNYCVKVGDSITINVSKLLSHSWRGVSTYFSDHMSPQHLLVDWANRHILVKSNLTLNNSFVNDQWGSVSANAWRSKAVGGLKDPLVSLLWHFEPFIRSLSR